MRNIFEVRVDFIEQLLLSVLFIQQIFSETLSLPFNLYFSFTDDLLIDQQLLFTYNY